MHNSRLFTVRELSEVELSLAYAICLAHGTTGHNSYMLNAKMSQALGMSWDPTAGLDIGENEILAGVTMTSLTGDKFHSGGEDVREVY